MICLKPAKSARPKVPWQAGNLPTEAGNLMTGPDDLDGKIGLIAPSQKEELNGRG
jgi:hypothetical protein